MGLGDLICSIRIQTKPAIASATTQFHLLYPSLSTESSGKQKPSVCFSVIVVAGSNPDRTNLHQHFTTVSKVSALTELS